MALRQSALNVRFYSASTIKEGGHFWSTFFLHFAIAYERPSYERKQ